MTATSSTVLSAKLAAHLYIDGMSCASCVGRVEKALKMVPDVKQVNVNLANNRADIDSFSLLLLPKTT